MKISPFTDFPEVIIGMAWNIKEDERFSTIHKGKLYFIAGFQEDYTKANLVAAMDLESGVYEKVSYLSEWISKTELSDLMFSDQDDCVCVVTEKRGDGYTQGILFTESQIIWGISKTSGKLVSLDNIHDLADDMRIIMEDNNDGDICFSMGRADEPESEFKRYKGFEDTVIEDKK